MSRAAERLYLIYNIAMCFCDCDDMIVFDCIMVLIHSRWQKARVGQTPWFQPSIATLPDITKTVFILAAWRSTDATHARRSAVPILSLVGGVPEDHSSHNLHKRHPRAYLLPSTAPKST